MAGFVSRNILALFVPILAFLSAYWFRKKRKLKHSLEMSCEKEEHSNQVIKHADDNQPASVDSRDCNVTNSDISISKLSSETATAGQSILTALLTEEIKFASKDELVLGENQMFNHISGSIDVCSGRERCSKNGSANISEADEVNSPDVRRAEICQTSECEKLLSQSPIQEAKYDTKLLERDKNSHVVETDKHLCAESVCKNEVKQNEIHRASVCNSDSTPSNRQASDELLKIAMQLKTNCINSLSEIVSTIHSEVDVSSPIAKNSPTCSGSPVSNNNDVSDCEALSSIGTSSISLNELISVSPVDLSKEHVLSYQGDSFPDEDVCTDSGKGSTLVVNPESRCSIFTEFDESASIRDHVENGFSPPSSSQTVCLGDKTVAAIESSSSSEQFFHNAETNGHLNSSSSQLCNESVNSQNQEVDVNSKCDVQVLDSKLFDSPYVYEFELPQELCGRLIGKHGKHVNFIKEQTNASVYIKRHPYNHRLKLAVVEGTRAEVNDAMEIIRKKYPPSMYPNLTLAQTNTGVSAIGVPVPESLQLHLPERTSCDVILSSMVSASHFFLQQPTHPTYSSLSALDQCMMVCYSQGDTPRLSQVMEAGIICAATVMGGWYRAQVVCVHENSEDCDVKFVDYGGYSSVPISSLRQIRSDFMTLPFQASECYLANVQPLNEFGWTPEASATFEELAQGQILQAVVVDYHEDGIPFVHLYRVQGVTSTFINQELVNRGVAKWIEHR